MAKGKGLKGMNYSDIMMAQAFQQASNPVYCRYCGLDVKVPSDKQSETNWSQNADWETQWQAHVSCHNKHKAESRGR